MKIVVITAKQSTLVNLNGLKSNLKLHSDEHKRSVRITIVIRAKLQNTVEKQVTDLVGIRRKLLIGKAD